VIIQNRLFSLSLLFKSLNQTLDAFDKFAEQMHPHVSEAQILIDLGPHCKTLQEALDVLSLSEIQTFRYKIVREKPSGWAILYIPSQMMKTATLKLSEAGFTKISGLAPRHEPQT